MADETSSIEIKAKTSLGELLKTRQAKIVILLALIVLVAGIWGAVFLKMGGDKAVDITPPADSQTTAQPAAATQDAVSNGAPVTASQDSEAAVADNPEIDEYMDKTFKYRDPFKGN